MFDIVSAMTDYFSRKIGGANPLRRNFVKSRPTGAALRNPADPIHAARIEAAAVKRARRQRKLHNDAVSTLLNNRAHCAFRRDVHDEVQLDAPLNLHTLYIAK